MKVKKLKRVILKEEFVAITNSLEGALILAQMCYWSERVYDIDKFLEEECMAYAEENNLKHHGWIRKSAKQLSEEMHGAMTARTVQRHIQGLVDLKFLDQRTNPIPKYKFDHTLQYRVNFCNIQKALKNNGYVLSDYRVTECFDMRDFSTGQNDQSESQVVDTIGNRDQTIIESISKIESKDNNVVSETIAQESLNLTSESADKPKREKLEAFKTRACGLMGRRTSTAWSVKELRLCEPHLDTTDEDWKYLEAYYANRGKKDFYCRKNMETLLNNWAGEIDKSREHALSKEKTDWDTWKPSE